jgi:predicted ATPase
MEIKIFNFGPIKEFQLDLSKDLIIAYGRNNIGKSYAISVVYLLLKNIMEGGPLSTIGSFGYPTNDETMQTLESKVKDKKQCVITRESNNMFKYHLNSLLAEKFDKSFKTTFGQFRNVKNVNAKELPRIEINVLNHIIRIEVGETIRVKEFSMGRDVFSKIEEKKYGVSLKEDRYTIWLASGGVRIRDQLGILFLNISNEIFQFIHNTVGNLYFLPASRSGLSMGMDTYKPLFAKLSQSNEARGMKFEIPAMPEPYSDYILMLSEIKGIPTKNKLLNRIVKDLEEKVLGGNVGFDTETKRLTYSPGKSELVLDMNSVSSMVSELSPFVALFKYIFPEDTGKSKDTPKPVIFIEEPEAHLHPDAQVLLAEILAMLAQNGIKVVITSHGDYIFHKLGNMLLAGILNPAKIAPLVLKDTPGGSVSHAMEADDLGIEDENFIDTADALYEERELIIDERNKEADDR